jgi:hypothetical protein
MSSSTCPSRAHTLRNVVREMVAELVAVKPIREPLQELQVLPSIRIART